MSRRLYGCLVRMHPPAFRREFAAEMLWIYDQAAKTCGWALLADALVSLARQWLVRSGLWKILLAAAGGLLQVSFVCAGMAGIRRARVPHALAGPNPELAALMRLTALVTVGLLAAVMLLVLWWRMLARRKGA